MLTRGSHIEKVVKNCEYWIERLPQVNNEMDGVYIERLTSLKRQASAVLVHQEKEPTEINGEPQRRNADDGVEYAVGMVMKHKMYNYMCVIYGWDKVSFRCPYCPNRGTALWKSLKRFF